VVFQGGFFCLGRSFPFPSLIGFFPSFCQALAEDRVTTPTKKKKKVLEGKDFCLTLLGCLSPILAYLIAART